MGKAPLPAAQRVAGRHALQVFFQQLVREVAQRVGRASHQVVQVDDLGTAQQGLRFRVGFRVQEPPVLRSLQHPVVGPVEAAQAFLRRVDLVDDDGFGRAAGMQQPAAAIRQAARRHIDDHQPAGAELFVQVVDQGAPDRERLHLDAIEHVEVVVRRAELGPLVIEEVHGQGVGQAGRWLQAQRAQHPQPDVREPVGFWPDPVLCGPGERDAQTVQAGDQAKRSGGWHASM